MSNANQDCIQYRESYWYQEFKTGLSFQEVYGMIWSASEDPRHWPKTAAQPKISKRTGKKTAGRRHSVLGKWREIKLQMWCDYLQRIGGPDNLPPVPNKEAA